MNVARVTGSKTFLLIQSNVALLTIQEINNETKVTEKKRFFNDIAWYRFSYIGHPDFGS